MRPAAVPAMLHKKKQQHLLTYLHVYGVSTTADAIYKLRFVPNRQALRCHVRTNEVCVLSCLLSDTDVHAGAGGGGGGGTGSLSFRVPPVQRRPFCRWARKKWRVKPAQNGNVKLFASSSCRVDSPPLLRRQHDHDSSLCIYYPSDEGLISSSTSRKSGHDLYDFLVRSSRGRVAVDQEMSAPFAFHSIFVQKFTLKWRTPPFSLN